MLPEFLTILLVEDLKSSQARTIQKPKGHDGFATSWKLMSDMKLWKNTVYCWLARDPHDELFQKKRITIGTLPCEKDMLRIPGRLSFHVLPVNQNPNNQMISPRKKAVLFRLIRSPFHHLQGTR